MKTKVFQCITCILLVITVGVIGINKIQASAGQTNEVVTPASEIKDKLNINTDSSKLLEVKFIENTDYKEVKDYSIQNAANIIDYLNEDSTDNVIISEASLNIALSMLLEGSQENSRTYNELFNYLNNSNYSGSIQDILDKNRAIITQYNQNELITTNIANSIWGNNIYFTDDFTNNIIQYFNSTPQTLDFNDMTSADIINNWVAANTNNNINEVVNHNELINSQAILINTLYFNSQWLDPFESENIKTEYFTNADHSTSEVSMMYSTVYNYYENDNCVAFSKPYEDTNYVFIGILPKTYDNFTITELDLDSLLETETNSYNVDIGMPQFNFNSENYLYDALYNNGLVYTLSDNNSDFIMSDVNLTISDIIQNIYISVDSNGTEAASATTVICPKSTPITEEKETKKITLNRPFAFIIYDTANHECLFIGKINTL